MIKIAIRADGSPNIGTGHIQRCLALSSQLQKEGMEVLFITKSNRLVKERVKQEGFEIVELNNNSDLEEDLERTIEIIKTNKIDVLITDSYEFDEKYLSVAKKNVKMLVSVDDLANITFPSDIVINQNIYAKNLEFRSLTGKTKFLLGSQYALLRKEFSGLGKRKINGKVHNVLITLGGSDNFNLTPKILNMLGKIQDEFKITTVISYFFNNVYEIEKAIKKMIKRVEVIYNSSQMADLMLSADLAITGGGTTLYELAATGTSALAFCLADNQYKNVVGMAEVGTVVNLGWGNAFDEENFHQKINKLIKDYQSRKKMSKLGQKLVDGKGSSRCAQEILREGLLLRE